jgi:type VI secretion system protein ImpA
MELVGANNAPSFDEMNKVLGEILHTVAPYLPQDSSAALDALLSDVSPSSSGGASAAAHSGTFSGQIASRADVIRAIDQICDYYRTAEPGNPVPLLLRRAQRLVDKDFMALMEDLLPESVSQLSNITGQKRDTDSYSPPPEESASE